MSDEPILGHAFWTDVRVDVQITTEGRTIVYAWTADEQSQVTLSVGSLPPYMGMGEQLIWAKPSEFTIAGKGVRLAEPIGFDTASLVAEVARLRAEVADLKQTLELRAEAGER